MLTRHLAQPLVKQGDLINPYSKHILCALQVDSYNRYTIEINSLTWIPEQEFLLDQRHRYFVSCTE